MTAGAAAAPCGASPPRPTPLVKLLQLIQAADATRVENFDLKFYVDLSLKTNISAATTAFNNLPRHRGRISEPDLKRYIGEYFADAGSDLVVHVPGDFEEVPKGFLPKVKHPEVRAWALDLHALWKNLSRKVSEEVKQRPERHTLLPLPASVVVPGGRFREVYYWDSYWTIRGLLASKMYDTAKAIVYNLVWLIDTYGFVLNGARTYYSNRSQPPLLSAMIDAIYTRTADLVFVNKTLPALRKEHCFWSSGIHKVTIQDLEGHNHSLSRYNAMWKKPRPESATTDEEFASRLSTTSEKENFYHQVASAAESGWDFSSRWMKSYFRYAA